MKQRLRKTAAGQTKTQTIGLRNRDAQGEKHARPVDGKVLRAADRMFSIDLRSLALFRIVVSMILLTDLAIRFSDLGAMYTDEGMFSRGEIVRRVTTAWNWSFHFGSGTWGYQAALFALAMSLGICLAVGYETRLATIGSWLLLVSVQHRVPPVLSGADILLRMLLFWAMFLPLGRMWSVERWRRKKQGKTTDAGLVLSVGSAAILIQMGLMYLFSALFKTNSEWLQGKVIKASLEHSFYAKPLGTWLLQLPEGLLSALTVAVLALEWIGPLLLFSPWQTHRARLAALAALVLMHLGIGMTLAVDLFSWVAIAGLCLFVPKEAWDWVTEKIWKRENSIHQVEHRPRQPVGAILSHVVCGALLLYVIWVNVRSLPMFSAPGNAPKPSFLRTACGLGQRWNMFDQAPAKSGWYIAAATLKNGQTVDLLRNGSAVNWRPPEFPGRAYPNFRWKKLFREMAFEDALGYQFFRKPVAAFLCREWNEKHGEAERVDRFELIYNMQMPVDGNPDVKEIEQERMAELDLSEE